MQAEHSSPASGSLNEGRKDGTNRGGLMKGSVRRRGVDPEGRLSIGALSRLTGVPVETLRTWEHRYGFPVPERKSSGHRVYPLSTVARIRLVAEALARGHRAGEVVPASTKELTALIEATPPRSTNRDATRVEGQEVEIAGGAHAPLFDGRAAPPARTTEAVTEAMEAVAAFDSTRLARLLTRDWAWLGPQAFLRDRVAPLLSAVGQAWAEGKLEIRHEHFVSERVTDILRTFRLPFEEAARGPLVVLATLPGEQHGLGLQMCSLILAVGGCRVLNLGVEVPVAEIANLVADTGARAVGLSISPATGDASTRQQIEELRRLLPPHVQLVVGGKGAPPDVGPGIEVMGELSTVQGWARQAARDGGR